MAHTTPMANVHYCMKTIDNFVDTCTLLRNLRHSSSEDSGEERSDRAPKRGREDADDGETGAEQDFAAFLQAFPLNLTGQPPTKKQRADAGFPTDTVFYDRWRALQYGQREKHLLSSTLCCVKSSDDTALSDHHHPGEGKTHVYSHLQERPMTSPNHPELHRSRETESISKRQTQADSNSECVADGSGISALVCHNKADSSPSLNSNMVDP
ncbi:uncharacterized protein LOC144467295 [Epinephelus lanceolatus]